MSTRAKKTLYASVRWIVVLALIAMTGLARPHTHFAMNAISWAVVLVAAASVVYTWWWYGNSEKAVALRAKAEQRKAAKLTR